MLLLSKLPLREHTNVLLVNGYLSKYLTSSALLSFGDLTESDAFSQQNLFALKSYEMKRCWTQPFFLIYSYIYI